MSYIPTINNNVLKTNSKLKSLSLSLSLSLSNDGSSFSHLCILVMEILQRWVNSQWWFCWLDLGLTDMGIKSLMCSLVVYGNFVVELGSWLLDFPRFPCGGEKLGFLLKGAFPFGFLTYQTLHEGNETFCAFFFWFLWLLSLIFLATKSKVIAFFVKFYFKKNNQRNALLVLLNLKRKSEENYIKFKEWILGSINRLFKILRLDKK